MCREISTYYSKTNQELLQNKHLWEASKNLGLSSETARFLRGKILDSKDATQLLNIKSVICNFNL